MDDKPESMPLYDRQQLMNLVERWRLIARDPTINVLERGVYNTCAEQLAAALHIAPYA